LEYEVEGDRATIRVHPGIRSLKGALASDKGKGMLSLKSARPRQRVERVAGEQAETGRH